MTSHDFTGRGGGVQKRGPWNSNEVVGIGENYIHTSKNGLLAIDALSVRKLGHVERS